MRRTHSGRSSRQRMRTAPSRRDLSSVFSTIPSSVSAASGAGALRRISDSTSSRWTSSGLFSTTWTTGLMMPSAISLFPAAIRSRSSPFGADFGIAGIHGRGRFLVGRPVVQAQPGQAGQLAGDPDGRGVLDRLHGREIVALGRPRGAHAGERLLVPGQLRDQLVLELTAPVLVAQEALE